MASSSNRPSATIINGILDPLSSKMFMSASRSRTPQLGWRVENSRYLELLIGLNRRGQNGSRFQIDNPTRTH